jgi:hypothetical protein
MPDGLALWFTLEEARGIDPGELDSCVYAAVRELDDKFLGKKGNAGVKPQRAPVLPAKDVLSEEEFRQLSYFKSMMEGVVGHLSMAFSEHTVEAITPHCGVPYSSAFDESDDEGIGILFQ